MNKNSGCGKIGFIGFCLCLCFFFFVKFFSGYSLYNTGYISNIATFEFIHSVEGVYTFEIQFISKDNEIVKKRVHTFSPSYKRGETIPILHDKKDIRDSSQFVVAHWWYAWGVWLVSLILLLIITKLLSGY